MFIGCNKTCMPSVRQIVDRLVPVDLVGCGCCLLADKNNKPCAIDNCSVGVPYISNKPVNAININSKKNDNNNNNSIRNMRLNLTDNTSILMKNCSRNT
ncbi:Protein of unknown function [Cotesia congregata]|uniref:Uncharacterized protein n=1 Tax=Cotesia congregata TaxID=51543 RepID=A0A8J2M9Z1_COTCN|nr:Protein of unknown function [Cotesia congregata]